MRKPVNRYDVQVVFPDIAFGIKHRTDVVQTPETVADALEEFCRRIRNGAKVPPHSKEIPKDTCRLCGVLRPRYTNGRVKPCNCTRPKTRKHGTATTRKTAGGD